MHVFIRKLSVILVASITDTRRLVAAVTHANANRVRRRTTTPIKANNQKTDRRLAWRLVKSDMPVKHDYLRVCCEQVLLLAASVRSYVRLSVSVQNLENYLSEIDVSW